MQLNDRLFRFMRRHQRILIARSLVLLVLVGVTAAGVHYLSQSHAAAAGVTVNGNRLYKDGQPFVPLGFTMVGMLAPPGCGGAGATAATHLNQNEMNVAKNVWKANTLRFQVSQNGLSGAGYPATEPATYLNTIKAGVQLARTNGFAVIISLQDEGVGCGPARPLPLPESVGVWQNLANAFKNDPYVMFELWNEPNNGTATTRPPTTSPSYNTTLTWPDWLNGRSTAIQPTAGEHWSPYVPVGHQRLVDVIRATGATNVLIGNGANRGEHLEGMPMLTDSLNPAQIAYSPHIYYFQTSVSDWDKRFGYLAATKPLVITEWNMNCGDAKQQSMAQQFLDYVKNKNIGITPWGFDFMNTLISDWNYTPTSPSNCSNKSGGLITKNYFVNYGGSVDNPPTVNLTAPTGGTVGGASVPVSANATDDHGVQNVVFSYKAAAASTWTTIGSPDTTNPYSVTWNTTSLANGSYNLRAIATDTGAQSTTSTTVTVTVSNTVVDNINPTASLAAAPTTVNVGSPVTLTATTTDNVGVTRVDFFAGSVLIATKTQATGTLTWNPTQAWTPSVAGTVSLTATAYDAAGNHTISTAVNVTVNNTPPGLIGDLGGNPDGSPDGHVNGVDYGMLISHLGQVWPPGNLQGPTVDPSNMVSAADVAILMGHWTW